MSNIKNSLDDIINLNIEISSPAQNSESFNNILVIVKEPDMVIEGDSPEFLAVSGTKELAEYGFSSEHQAYVAASVAFGQSPSPDILYFAIRKSTE